MPDRRLIAPYAQYVGATVMHMKQLEPYPRPGHPEDNPTVHRGVKARLFPRPRSQRKPHFAPCTRADHTFAYLRFETIFYAKNKIAGRFAPFLVLGFWDKTTGICAGTMPYRRVFPATTEI